MPKKIDLIICDFDGVLTDNRVWMDQDGKESMAAYRSDSLRIGELRAHGHGSDDHFLGAEYGCSDAREKNGSGGNSRRRDPGKGSRDA